MPARRLQLQRKKAGLTKFYKVLRYVACALSVLGQDSLSNIEGNKFHWVNHERENRIMSTSVQKGLIEEAYSAQPSPSYSITVRVRLDNKLGTIGEVTSAIGQA